MLFLKQTIEAENINVCQRSHLGGRILVFYFPFSGYLYIHKILNMPSEAMMYRVP